MSRLICILFLPFLLFSANAYGGGEVTFHLEDLSRPENLLNTKSFNEVYYDLLHEDYKLTDRQSIAEIASIESVLSHSLGGDRFVSFGNNSFFFGMCEAYAHHRPVVLSPDVIWILISQGFAHHINVDSERFRDMIVGFDGKQNLTVAIESSFEDADWNQSIDDFFRKLSSDTKNGLAETMLCDFSTTDQVDRMVSQVTLMETVKSYYDFVVLSAICGIPSITLQGTADDWRKVREKTLALEKYDLAWWTKRLIPVLDEFVKAADGHADVAFWKKMIHVTEPGKCGDPRIIDGWITDFFPYDKDGRRLKGGSITSKDKLPAELVKVKLRAEVSDGSSIRQDGDIEVWAGIWGLDQDAQTFALAPKTGWMVRKTDGSAFERELFSRANRPDGLGIRLAVDSIPSALRHIGRIHRLDLTFKNKAELPDWFGDLEIDRLVLRGQIPLSVRFKAKKMCDNVRINPSARRPL